MKMNERKLLEAEWNRIGHSQPKSNDFNKARLHAY